MGPRDCSSRRRSKSSRRALLSASPRRVPHYRSRRRSIRCWILYENCCWRAKNGRIIRRMRAQRRACGKRTLQAMERVLADAMQCCAAGGTAGCPIIEALSARKHSHRLQGIKRRGRCAELLKLLARWRFREIPPALRSIKTPSFRARGERRRAPWTRVYQVGRCNAHDRPGWPGISNAMGVPHSPR